MKLSKAQQEVVDKMRDGWELRLSETGRTYLINGLQSINTRQNTFASLRHRMVIEMRSSYMNGWVYRLTEQYKNEQK